MVKTLCDTCIHARKKIKTITKFNWFKQETWKVMYYFCKKKQKYTRKFRTNCPEYMNRRLTQYVEP